MKDAFISYLKAKRAELGVAGILRRFAMGRTTLYSWIDGRTSPPLETARDFVVALGDDPDIILRPLPLLNDRIDTVAKLRRQVSDLEAFVAGVRILLEQLDLSGKDVLPDVEVGDVEEGKQESVRQILQARSMRPPTPAGGTPRGSTGGRNP